MSEWASDTLAIEEFLGMERLDDRRWRVAIAERISNWSSNLFGGAGLAIGIAALEAATGRPVVWATAQYVGQARIGELIELRVELLAEGRSVTQGRAVGCVGHREIFTVSAALGRRDVEGEGSWEVQPSTPAPLDSPPRRHRRDVTNSINAHLELRVATGRDLHELTGEPSADGRSAMWARVPGGTLNAARLALLGDWVPSGISQALGRGASGTSLDNTLRVVQLVETPWLLLDIRVHAIHSGFGHGLVHLWAEDATLVATASQSVMLRYWPDWTPPPA